MAEGTASGGRNKLLILTVLALALGSIVLIPPPSHRLFADRMKDDPVAVAKEIYQSDAFKEFRYRSCEATELVASVDQRHTDLARAIIAVEYQLAGAFEMAVENSVLILSPRLAAYLDWSYGPAQIRPSTVSRLLPELPDDAFHALSDGCGSLAILAQIIETQADKRFDSAVRRAIVLHHAGAREFALLYRPYASSINYIYLALRDDQDTRSAGIDLRNSNR